MTIRAAVMPAPDAVIEVRELPEPELEPGSALPEVERSEVCGVRILEDPDRDAPWSRRPTTTYGLQRAEEAEEDVAAGRGVKALIDPAA